MAQSKGALSVGVRLHDLPEGTVEERIRMAGKLGFELTIDGIHGGTVLGLAHQVIEFVEGFARVDVVEVVLLGIVMLDGAVILDKEVDIVVGEGQVTLLAGDLFSSMSALIMQPSM